MVPRLMIWSWLANGGGLSHQCFWYKISDLVRNSFVLMFEYIMEFKKSCINRTIMQHSGPLHIALGSWVLVSFGPQVCKGYGSFTFLLIFILGGISGNFSSFLHTSEATVGGSVRFLSSFVSLLYQTWLLLSTNQVFYTINFQGPVFAVIGAWLVYQIQNKELVSKELSDSMFQKAVIATALSFFLGNFGPVDNW